MNQFSFPEWKIKCDISNRLPIVKTSYAEIFDKINEIYPQLEGIVLDILYDGTYVIIDIDKLTSLDPLTYNNISYPDFKFELSKPNGSGWILKYHDDIYLYDGVTFYAGSFSSAGNYVEENIDNRQKIMQSIVEGEKSISFWNKEIEKSTRAYYETQQLKDMIEDAQDNIFKLKRFLQEANKELEYDSKTKIFVKKRTQTS